MLPHHPPAPISGHPLVESVHPGVATRNPGPPLNHPPPEGSASTAQNHGSAVIVGYESHQLASWVQEWINQRETEVAVPPIVAITIVAANSKKTVPVVVAIPIVGVASRIPVVGKPNGIVAIVVGHITHRDDSDSACRASAVEVMIDAYTT